VTRTGPGQRLLKTRPFSDTLSTVHLWGWQLLIVAGALALVTGNTQAKECAELPWPLDVADRKAFEQPVQALVLFGLGTAPALLGVSLADELLARRRAFLNRLAHVFILAMGGWLLWKALLH
jgi:hypothetical protein